MAFSSEDNLLAVGYDDDIIQLWDPFAGTLAGPPLPPTDVISTGGGVPDDPVTALRFSPDGSLLLSADHDGNVNSWKVWQYTHPYAALCSETGPLAKDTYQHYASSIPEPPGICAGMPPASTLSG